MNNIYDFNELPKIKEKQKTLVIGYILSVIGFIGVLVIACSIIRSVILLSLFFSLFLLVYILSSIVFWKVKYAPLNEHRLFIDNMEMGAKSDFAGYFQYKEKAINEDENFENYVFISSNKKTAFLIHKQYSKEFKTGEKYHIEHVGNYIYSWELI